MDLLLTPAIPEPRSEEEVIDYDEIVDARRFPASTLLMFLSQVDIDYIDFETMTVGYDHDGEAFPIDLE